MRLSIHTVWALGACALMLGAAQPKAAAQFDFLPYPGSATMPEPKFIAGDRADHDHVFGYHKTIVRPLDASLSNRSMAEEVTHPLRYHRTLSNKRHQAAQRSHVPPGYDYSERANTPDRFDDLQ